jgi:hypothetical protein
MTLAKRFRRLKLALRLLLALAFLVELAVLWRWAYHLGELSFLPASIQLGPLGRPALYAAIYIPFLLSFLARIAAEHDAERLAALADLTHDSRPVNTRVGEGKEPETVPVWLSWWHGSDELLLLVWFVPIWASAVAVIPTTPTALSILAMVMWFLSFALALWWIFRYRRKIDAVFADEEGIRGWRLGVAEPLLPWNSIRLLLVDLTTVGNSAFLTYRVYDEQGHEVSWRLSPPVGQNAIQKADADNARRLVWMTRTHTRLAWHTSDRALMKGNDARIAASQRLDRQTPLVMPLLRFYAALPVMMLALAVLAFPADFAPWLGVASAFCLGLLALSMLTRGAWPILTFQRRVTGDIARGPTLEREPRQEWWKLVEATLALVGGALGFAVRVHEIFALNFPSWSWGAVAVEFGAPVLAVIGGYYMYRLGRNRQDTHINR